MVGKHIKSSPFLYISHYSMRGGVQNYGANTYVFLGVCRQDESGNAVANDGCGYRDAQRGLPNI